MPTVLEYKCPCCGAGLTFDQDVQKMTCAYCDNEFTLEAVKAYQESAGRADTSEFEWEENIAAEWQESEQDMLHVYTCSSCGGQLITTETTAATFCPYCENPAILPGRLSGGLKPDGVLPFKTSKEDAQKAFLQLCKGKPLLPKLFTQQQRIEKITGVYVPFWLYQCAGSLDGRYNATRLHCWADARYNYTRTDHFLLIRAAEARFSGIPMDGSSKMDDSLMESIEPYDYSQVQDFDMACLSGFLADKYDVEAKSGQERIRQRVAATMDDMVQNTFLGYASVLPASKQMKVAHNNARYVLLPVWVLNTRYRDKIYTFMMNGQTGKMTGSFPICPKRTALWFAGICGAVTALAALIQWFLF